MSNCHSTLLVLISVRKPVKALMAIMYKEVPIAVLISRRKKNIRAGTMRKPPPAPSNPVISPVTIADKMSAMCEGGGPSSVLSVRFPMIIPLAAINMIKANAIILTAAYVSVMVSVWYNTGGIAGRRYLLVNQITSIDIKPKMLP